MTASPSPTDAELVAQVLSGQTGPFATLIGRHHPSCMRYARHFLGDATDAEDAVQETVFRAYRGLGRYRERESFRAWLFQILVNRCRTAAVRRRTRRERFVTDESALARASVQSGEALSDANRRLERALEGLDPDHRAAFLLRVGEEMEYEEISRLVRASVPAVKMRVKRARDHVRARWGESTNG